MEEFPWAIFANGPACTNAGVVEKEFWRVMQARGCTSLAGVPVTYAMLERLRIERMALPALRTLTRYGWGPWLLLLIATGIAAFGLFAFAQARYRDG